MCIYTTIIYTSIYTMINIYTMYIYTTIFTASVYGKQKLLIKAITTTEKHHTIIYCTNQEIKITAANINNTFKIKKLQNIYM